MTPNINKQQDPIGYWIKESGKNKAPKDFYKSVLLRIESNSPISPYTPVIPTWLIRVLTLGAAAIIILGLVFLPDTGQSQIWSSSMVAAISYISFPKLPTLDIEYQSNLIMYLSIIVFSTMAFLATIITSKNVNY